MIEFLSNNGMYPRYSIILSVPKGWWLVSTLYSNIITSRQIYPKAVKVLVVNESGISPLTQ